MLFHEPSARMRGSSGRLCCVFARLEGNRLLPRSVVIPKDQSSATEFAGENFVLRLGDNLFTFAFLAYIGHTQKAPGDG